MNLRYFLLAVSILSFTACQDVIEVELSNVQIKPVIEGSINDVDTGMQVSITTSQEFYDASPPPPIDRATVQLVSGAETYVFEHIGDRFYRNDSIRGVLGQEYELEVIIDGELYAASSSIPSERIPIDSVSFKFEEESIFRDEGIYPTIYFKDPPQEGNYYRIIATVNGLPFDFNYDDPDADPDLDTQINVRDDKFTNDLIQDVEIFYNLQSGDVLKVELQHLGRQTYDYLRTLEDARGADGVAPADPLSNFGTSALGYFGAYSTSKISITVP